jgi:hypothetical protein
MNQNPNHGTIHSNLMSKTYLDLCRFLPPKSRRSVNVDNGFSDSALVVRILEWQCPVQTTSPGTSADTNLQSWPPECPLGILIQIVFLSQACKRSSQSINIVTLAVLSAIWCIPFQVQGVNTLRLSVCDSVLHPSHSSQSRPGRIEHSARV